LNVIQGYMKLHYSVGYYVITFRVRRGRGEMYIGHGRLCVCLSMCLTVPRLIPALLQGPGCNYRVNGRGCSLAVHYLADL